MSLYAAVLYSFLNGLHAHLCDGRLCNGQAYGFFRKSLDQWLSTFEVLTN